MEETTPVAIVGAGPAGLAVAACLRQAGIDFVMLEKAAETAPSWRRHYDRLHLHTVKQHSALPLVPFPQSYPRYVPRAAMVSYLEDYAARFDLRPRFGETVHAIRPAKDGWRVEGDTVAVQARHVVIASGYNAEPVKPDLAGLATFHGPVLHSGDYRNGRAFAGQSVLIVGMGNTGAEIALDLAEAGARPAISVRGGVHIVPRELFGVPIQVVALLATKALPAAANDRVFPFILDAALGDLSRHGIKRPKEGILARIAKAARIPVIDVGTVKGIRSGAIKVVPSIKAITARGAVFADGRCADYDAIILATGFTPNYANLFGGEKPGAARPGVHFVGFNNVVTGLLREISREAERTAEAIRRDSIGTSAPRRNRSTPGVGPGGKGTSA